MSIKDILVLLDANSQAAGRYAVSAASTFDAHLTAAALVTAPTSSIGFTGAPSAFLTAVLEEERSTARQILEAFALEARRSNRAIQTEIARRAPGPFSRRSEAWLVTLTSHLSNSPTPMCPARPAF
jgi:hypothetical protein